MDLEQKKALETYGHFNSTHEVYGVLIEEVQEFFEVVREPLPKSEFNRISKAERMIDELDQIRAVATRAMNELKANQIKFV